MDRGMGGMRRLLSWRAVLGTAAAALGTALMVANSPWVVLSILKVVLGTTAAALGLTLLVANLPWILPKRAPFSLPELGKAMLVSLDGSGKVEGRELWEERGAVIMVEAASISSLLPLLEAKNVPLYGIVHEEIGVKKFRNFFKGDLFLDKQKAFFSGRMGLLGVFRLHALRTIVQARINGFSGNTVGDGTQLGACLVVGPAEQGILLQHLSLEFGDRALLSDITAAVERIGVPQ